MIQPLPNKNLITNVPLLKKMKGKKWPFFDGLKIVLGDCKKFP